MEIEEAVAAEEHHEMEHFAGVEPQGFVHGSFASDTSTATCRIVYTPSARMWLYVLIVLTCVPLVVGGAFTSIFVEDKNFNAAVCAFFAASISLGTLSLFFFHLFGKIEIYHDQKTLGSVKILGMLMSVASGIMLGVYTILAFLTHQSFQFYGLNYFSSAVFSGMCLATSLQLYIVAQWYQNAVQQQAGSRSASTPAQSGMFP